MKLPYHPIIPMLAFSGLLASCSDFLTLDTPKSEIVATTVFGSDATAEAAVLAIYRELAITSTNFAGGGSTGSITVLAGLSADELDYNLEVAQPLALYQNMLQPDNTYLSNCWSSAYYVIHLANSLLEGLAQAPTPLDPAFRGEALFLRAFAYFHLTNAFGDVPLVTGTDYRINNRLPRSSTDACYRLVENDLLEAIALLPDGYARADGLRIRANRSVAQALLARVYLYGAQWARAAATASQLIDATNHFALETDLGKVFLKTSREAIWQLKPIATSMETRDANTVIPLATRTTPPIYSLSAGLLAAFDPADRRRAAWVDAFTPRGGTTPYLYPAKYKVRTSTNTPEAIAARMEYSTVLRLAEQYLIRAEARLRTGDLHAAAEDLNAIRVQHGGLPPLDAGTAEAALSEAIMRERAVEFFYEWGHRWFDLKRWGLADAVLSTAKPHWKTTAALFPVPLHELDANPNLLPQNPGY